MQTVYTSLELKLEIMNRILFILLIGLLLLPTRSISQVNQTEIKFDLQNTKKILTEEINKILKETGIPSVSISLIKDETIIWSEAFGYANVKKQIPATSSTIYSTGSNFKFVTATAIMQLAEAGKFEETQLTEEVLRKYTGKYQLTPEFFISVSLEGTHLYAQATGQAKFELFAYEEDKFFFKVVYAQVKFNIENGKVASLTLFQNGETEGKKIE